MISGTVEDGLVVIAIGSGCMLGVILNAAIKTLMIVMRKTATTT